MLSPVHTWLVSAELSITKLKQPGFDFVQFFTGHVRASGWFADRFGNIKTHFCGDIFGSQLSDTFNLEKTLYYSDGLREEHQFFININNDGSYISTSSSYSGNATGRQSGHSLTISYSMNSIMAAKRFRKLAMVDQMFYQPDGSLHNITKVSRWKFTIGYVNTQYQRHDGDLVIPLRAC